MEQFLTSWSDAVRTSINYFRMAFWAFALGYLISSLIQVLISRARMQKTMGQSGPVSVAMGTFFGFISSSCSFSALSTTRALFQKGAGLVPSLAFMLASTNLVIELGFVIAIFLGWQFVVGEYAGGVLLIIFAWLFVRFTRPEKLTRKARDHLENEQTDSTDGPLNWKRKLVTLSGWQEIGTKYVMEWKMIWKDVLIGFTVAGIISAFVPDVFFESLFLGSGSENPGNPGLLMVIEQTLIGPIAAFFTFIGSMGNIPLASLLYNHGVSFAGIMAFIFSDLVVLPVLRINAKYYGWRMALYILCLLLTCLVVTSLVLHFGFSALDILPAGGGNDTASALSMDTQYAQVLNVVFLAVSGLLVFLWWTGRNNMSHEQHHNSHSSGTTGYILSFFTILSIVWLAGGLIVRYWVIPGS